MKMRIGIDLLWVRHGICGGTESYIRNLIQGFGKYDAVNEYVLFAAQDNRKFFEEYLQCGNIIMVECPVDSAVPFKRILWENLHLEKKAEENHVDVMFIPVYSKPWTRKKNIPYVSVIHDLQAIHYPRYFSFAKRLFFRCAWSYTCRSSRRIIAISEFVREDLVKNFPKVRDKAETIYNPVVSVKSECSFGGIAQKYGIEPEGYYYCVSSLLPHKNLETILKVMAALKKRGSAARLVLSGVGGEEDRFNKALEKHGLEGQVVQTGYVSDEERDCLYENCRIFLFPSVFEGFGMPPVEAMRKGKNVVTTVEASLKEVTEGRAFYVEEPKSVEAWIEKIELAEKQEGRTVSFERYELKRIVEQYMAQWESLERSTEGI